MAVAIIDPHVHAVGDACYCRQRSRKLLSLPAMKCRNLGVRIKINSINDNYYINNNNNDEDQ